MSIFGFGAGIGCEGGFASTRGAGTVAGGAVGFGAGAGAAAGAGAGPGLSAGFAGRGPERALRGWAPRVRAHRRRFAAGATALSEPADQPHGARHGTLVDPFGHRWMLSQPLEAVSTAEYAARSEGSGFEVLAGPRAGQRYVDGIWSVVAYQDPDAGIRFVTEVLGFEELVLVRGDDGRIVHSEYRWPDGGIVQLAGVDPDNPFLPPPGQSGLYVVPQDPQSVWERCQAAGVEVLRPPEEPHYDPGGMGFSIRDAEGNAWSFGTYVGGATE